MAEVTATLNRSGLALKTDGTPEELARIARSLLNDISDRITEEPSPSLELYQQIRAALAAFRSDDDD